MLNVFLLLILLRPFLSSLAFPCENAIYSGLCLAFFIAWIMADRLSLECAKQVKYPLFLLVISIGVSLVFEQNKIAGIAELDKYAQAVLFFLTASCLNDEQRKKIIPCLLCAGIAVTILAFSQYLFGFKYLSAYMSKKGINDAFAADYISRARPFFPFVTPNTLAAYLAILVPLCLSRKHWALISAPVFAALFLTKSIGGLLGALLGVALFVHLSSERKKKTYFFLAPVAVILAFAFILRIAGAKSHTHPAFSAAMRIEYWRQTFGIIKAHPLTGIGPGNFDLTHSMYAHNSYLQIWAELGLFSLIGFIWLVWAQIRFGLKNLAALADKRENAAIICACATFLCVNLFDFSFFLPEVAVIWWVILGLLSRTNKPQLPQTSS